MDLSPPAAGLRDPLRRVRNKSNSPRRVEVIVAPGDNLAVSENVAAQLDAASTVFETVTDATAPHPVELEEEAPAKAPAKKKAPAKTPAKKNASNQSGGSLDKAAD